MSQLPSDPSIRKIVNDAIEEAVGSKIRQDAEKTLQSEIAEAVNEKTEMPKSEFSKRVAIRYKQEVNYTKYEEEKEWADVAYEENEILGKLK